MKLNVPPELQDTFQQLMKSVPPGNRRDVNFQKTTLVYLALGGEKMARHNIEISQMDFPDRSWLFEYTPIVEPVTEPGECQSDESE